MIKSVYLRLSILGLSKILMYEFQYDYAKPRYGEKSRLFYMDRDKLYRQKQMIFITTLQKMFKLNLILQTMSQIGYYQKQKIKKK